MACKRKAGDNGSSIKKCFCLSPSATCVEQHDSTEVLRQESDSEADLRAASSASTSTCTVQNDSHVTVSSAVAVAHVDEVITDIGCVISHQCQLKESMMLLVL